MSGDVVSRVDGQETSEELEAALKNTHAEWTSAPPADMEVAPCRAHGSPFVCVQLDDETGNRKIYEDGCKEPL